MASMFDVFRSAQSNAQRVSVENRDTVVNTNKSIISTGAGNLPANIFTLGDDPNVGQAQEDLAQVPPNTLNRIPRIVGDCVTGGIVVNKHLVGRSVNGNAINSYILVLSHTNIEVAWNTVNTASESELTILGDTRFYTDPGGVIGSSVLPGFCLNAVDPTSSQDNNCWSSGYTPAVYYNGQLCIFGSDGVVTGLADPLSDYTDPANVTTINNNFKVAVYVGHTDGSNQVFPGNGQDASNFAYIPNQTQYQGLVFACIQVTSDPEIDITGLGEWKFGIDNISNYLPAGNLYSRKRKNNPSITLQEYLVNQRYGLGLNPALIDTDSFAAWESNCTLDVFNGTAYGQGPGEWVYQDPDNSSGTLTEAPWMATNNAINTSLSVGDNIKRITQSGLAQLHWSHENQVFKIIKQRGQRIPDIDALFKFTSDNIIGKIDITSGDFFNLPTFADVRYPDKRLLSATNNIRMQVSANDLSANEPVNGVSYNFPMINGRARAQVMANISLYENREDTIISFNADYTTRDTFVGDYITITDSATGLDNQVARIIKVTEDITSDGGLIYRYQCKKYSDKPFQPQSYSDDPFSNTDENIFTQTPTYIRVIQAVVCDNPGSGLNTPITVYDYNYASNANTDVTPSSITTTSTTGGNMNINYGNPSFNNAFIAFAVKGTTEAMNKMRVVAKTGDYWMPGYGGHTYTFDSPLDGDPDYTGNTRYFLLKTDKLGQNGTASQPDNYVFDINYYYTNSYPNNTTNTFTIDHAMATNWNITGNALTTTTYGDTYVSQNIANITTTGSTQTTSTLQHDIGEFASDNYYVHVSGTSTLNPQTIDPGNANIIVKSDSFVEVVAVCDIEYTENYVNFTTGNTDAKTTEFAKTTRRHMVSARLNNTDLKQNTDVNFTAKIPINVYDDLGMFTTGRTQVFLKITDDITFTDRSGYWFDSAGTTVLSNLNYEIRNNTRMKDES